MGLIPTTIARPGLIPERAKATAAHGVARVPQLGRYGSGHGALADEHGRRQVPILRR